MKLSGVFVRSDPVLNGLTWGNWGSRPYEYEWVRSLLSVEGKKVIDLGTGIPSQYNWYQYVVESSKPSLYIGVDWDDRIVQEIEQLVYSDFHRRNQGRYELHHMDMAELKFADASFDVAYCISTFEHLNYDNFMKAIAEAHRVLVSDGVLLVTLDEEWDKDEVTTHANGWNTLEQSLIENKMFVRKTRSFGMPEFLELIKEYFVPLESVNYERKNKDSNILNSGVHINSCVSYVLLQKTNKK